MSEIIERTNQMQEQKQEDSREFQDYKDEESEENQINREIIAKLATFNSNDVDYSEALEGL
ncbi:790_t:CDS:2 [Entrophospora sp. SA101]|nr:790_t:CDS:2 [Entrophospora sp. SA101]CAJ0871399.1 9495_t:CDS:2 [Entrophospora sp. SA101]